MKTILITPEQASRFAIKHSVPLHRENIFCSHDSRSHEILIPAVPKNENDYYPGLVKICKTCNREVESDFLMKDVIPETQKNGYVPANKGISNHPMQLSPKTKETPYWAKKTTINHIKKPFIF